MRNLKRVFAVMTVSALLAGMAAFPAFAASKKISNVRIKVEAHIEPETEFGQEEIEITIGSGHYSYDSYEIDNTGFGWTENDVPEITIYLQADDDYYFSLKNASSVNLTGATYKTAKRENSSTTLEVTVLLPSLEEQVSNISTVTFGADGVVNWDAPIGAGGYNVKLLRNGTSVGSSKYTTATTYNFSSIMTKAADYTVKVQAVNKKNAEIKSDWTESDSVYIDTQAAINFRLTATTDGSAKGGSWMQDATGWWYQYTDNSYPKSTWVQINGDWYYFYDTGYMATGWVNVDGKQYYCNESGQMLENTTTPDGAQVGADGARIG